MYAGEYVGTVLLEQYAGTVEDGRFFLKFIEGLLTVYELYFHAGQWFV